jgi:hypothetical protein
VLLRESSEIEGKPINAAAIGGDGDTGVAHGALLVRFVDAALDVEERFALTEARAALRSAAGADAVVDAAAVIATFQRMNRFIDATGIPLDKTTEMVSRRLRADLGVDRFENAANTPPPGLLQRAFGPVFRPFTRLGLWWMSRLACESKSR